MDVYSLKKAEIIYELGLRGWSDESITNKNTDELRKLLRGHLSSEKANRSICEVQNDMLFDLDSVKLLESIRDLAKIISECIRPFPDAFRNRVSTRMIHVSNRFKRLNVDVSNVDHVRKTEEIKNEILAIESELADEHTAVQPAPFFESVNAQHFTSSSPITSRSSITQSPQIFKWQLQFDGNDAENTLMPFLEQLEELCVARGVSHESLFMSALDIFSGPARVWYSVNRHSVNNWLELVELLKKRFLPANYDREIRLQIEQVWQQEGENVSLFVARVKQLYARLSVPVPSSEIIAHIRERLVPFLIEHTALSKFDSVQSLEDLCADLERTRICVQRRALAFSSCATANCNSTSYCNSNPNSNQLVKMSVAAKPSNPANKIDTAISGRPSTSALKTSSSSIDTSKVVCYNCSQPGHYRSSCPQPFRRHCFRCGRLGATIRTCKKCQVSSVKDAGGK